MMSEYWGELPAPKQAVTLSYEDDIRAEVEKIIIAIHAGKISKNQVPEKLVDLVYKELDKAVLSGYGSLKRETDSQMITALKDNVFSFSTAKEFQFIQEAFSRLTLPDGTVKPFAQFREDVLKVHEKYNVSWLQTEHQAATSNAQIASRWQDVQANKSASPLLKFRAVMDARSRHKKYNGIVRPVDDPIWNWLIPILDWGCRCTVNSTSVGELTPVDKLPNNKDIRPAFRFNPGKEKMVFSESHPYFMVDGSAVQDMRKNWGLKRPD
ncbi:phage minor head protein [Cyclobacterium marinum]|uniref:phage head morphogenesis protein n=1 Tax=Cyclobacterium marinum TaxID=104 RepID=UPI0030DB6364|tara:strand:+ start:39296 stop:40096 length:801 start_codon:yes stop_codon:yes gene_type:complete